MESLANMLNNLTGANPAVKAEMYYKLGNKKPKPKGPLDGKQIKLSEEDQYGKRYAFEKNDQKPYNNGGKIEPQIPKDGLASLWKTQDHGIY